MLKNLTPQFLKTLDGWLLKNWPLVWRTRIHWVLLFSLLGHLLLVVGYWLYPVSMENLSISEIQYPIQIIACVFSLFALIYWGYSTIKIPIKNRRFSSLLLTGFIYWFGCLVICSNIFVVNNLVDTKLMAIIEEGTLKKGSEKVSKILNKIGNLDLSPRDKTTPSQVRELQRIEKKLTRRQFNINELIEDYQIEIPNQKQLDQYKDSGYTIYQFYDEFGVSISSILKRIEPKQEVIEYAYHTNSKLRLRSDYLLLYTIALIMLILVPILFLALPTIRWHELFLLLFGQLVFLAANDITVMIYSFPICYVIVGLGLIYVSFNKRNGSITKLIHIFFISLIPLVGLFYFMDHNYPYQFEKIILDYSFAPIVLYSLLIVGVTCTFFNPYLNRILNPQPN